MSSTSGDGAAGTPDDRSHTAAPRGDTPAQGETSGGSGDARSGQDNLYNEAAEEVADAMSAADSEEFQTAIGELRGDIVAGDKYNVVLQGHQRARVRARRIPGETLAQPHVGASGLRRIDEAVRRDGIVAVRGPQGSGRTAALLHVFAGGSRTISVLRLHPQTDLRTLAPEHIRDVQAVILEDLTEDHLDQLDEYEIDRLHDELANRWLGFTVSADIGLPKQLLPLVVDIGEPPAATEVFTRHLHAAQPSRARREELLRAADVQDRIDAALRPPVQLGRVAELAAFLAAYTGSLDELADWLDAWLTRGADAERQRWFESLPDVRAYCTAIALAVFQGLSRETVMAQAEHLIEHTVPPSDDETRAEASNVFTSATALTTLRATVTREKVAYAEGDLPTAVLRFTDPDYQSWVLQHAWDEFDAARPAILAWLRELGNHGEAVCSERDPG